MSSTDVIHRCGFCGETFEIDDDDPHWVTGRGPLCPNYPPVDIAIPALTARELRTTEYDLVIKRFARCQKHNTIRAHGDAPCWKCWAERAMGKS